MSSATQPGPGATAPDEDRTARSRIRHVALRLFGERGFKATTMRLIARGAGVSPALVVHHFGSKQGLRDAIDRALADKIRAGEFEMMTNTMSFSRNNYMARAEDYEDALPYLARVLAEGDELGRRLFDRLFADAIDYLEAGVEAGIIRPTDDPEARAASLLSASFGILFMQDHLVRVLEADDDQEMMLAITPVFLDLYTNGLFADDRALQAWRAEDHAARTADPDPPRAGSDPT